MPDVSALLAAGAASAAVTWTVRGFLGARPWRRRAATPADPTPAGPESAIKSSAETGEKDDGGASAPQPRGESASLEQLILDLAKSNRDLREELERLQRELGEQSHRLAVQAAAARTDPLTNLANRRAFEEFMAHRLAEHQRHGSPLSLILLDIDHFKAVNDRYGHPAGDAVLRGVAKALQGTTRGHDLLARLGGEEFAIVLPAAPATTALDAGDRVRRTIEKLRFSGSAWNIRVTISGGVAETKGDETLANLLARADEALYASKSSGRNCLHWHDGKEIRQASERLREGLRASS